MTTSAPPTPAARFIARFTVHRLATWTRRNRSRVHAWAWPRSRGGTGGLIPHAIRPAIIEGARAELGVELSYADFEPAAGEDYLTDGPSTDVPSHVRAREDLQ